MKNNLASDPSPYLQQHKDNPVHWQVWNNSTLKKAQENKKPILLSVGYSSCHWCHVMAHESFEDKEIAELMNKNFINIKVDREDRPDIDFIFQNSYQIFNQSGGGWPLTMFLDENAVPFMGGTYFPKNSTNGIPSFKEIILKISDVYAEKRNEIIKQSHLIKKSLELSKTAVLNQDLEFILENILLHLDNQKGGYKGAPKFPTYNLHDTLLYFFNKTKKKKYLEPVKLVLNKLCSEGIYDHVEGGVARYTVDEDWLIPHFEKMLYDNAQFIILLSKYLKIDKSSYFVNKIVQTIDFMNKNFVNKINGLLGSAFDADSEGKEGKYYIFNYKELKNIKDIEKYFEIKPEGNWEGDIILREIKTPPESILQQLISIRKNKKKPFFDSKSQLDLNSLWISSLVAAHNVLPNKNYLQLAENYFLNLEKVFLSEKELFHSNFKSITFIEDYAFTIATLLDLYESTMKTNYLIKAKELTKKAVELFYIKEKSIFQKNKLKSNDIFYEPIDIGDHTIPNGNSIMLMNFARLGMKVEGKELSNSLNGYLNVYKSFMTSSLKSIDYFNMIVEGKKCNQDGCDV